MLTRVVARCLGVVGHAQTISHGRFQLVLRNGKHASSFPCNYSSTYLSASQIRLLSNTRSNAAEEEAITVEAPVEILVTPKKRTRAKKPAATKSTSTKTARKTTGSTTSKKSSKKTAKIKKKAAPKKKKKPAVKKPVVKKRAAKKPLTPLKAYAAKIKTLRKEALLEGPKLLPTTGYKIFVVEQAAKGTKLTENSRIIAANFKALPLSEQEHLQNIAKQNQIENAKRLLEWTETHTPDEIRNANKARREINKIVKAPVVEGRRYHGIGSVRLIKDPRAVKLADTPYIAFARERWALGDFKGKRVTEGTQIISAEWKAMTDADKQKYREVSAQKREQYYKDYNAIFTRNKRSPPKASIQPIAD